ncbi:hypothetical protein [Halovivax cerinus]|uniref:Uncharacterized protein n=1 Tax=Halovivax cerinus TaxID=1487865 RepID=A0ABD5NSA1_9EURY|nr:hypothetical protein [Halovivax cerinus]
MTQAARLQWHRDADTSALIRLCWGLGAGTLFGALTLVVFGRLLGLTSQVGGRSLLLAALAGLAVTILALALTDDPAASLAAVTRYVPGIDYTPSDDVDARLSRGVDAAVGAVFVGGLIFALDTVVGGNVGQFFAAATIPVSLAFLLAAVFMRSTGVLDREEGVLYLYDPEDVIALDTLSGVSSRSIGGTSLVRLRYRTPDGEYVPGPRRLLVPRRVARELESIVE